jgi:hypothetical protein
MKCIKLLHLRSNHHLELKQAKPYNKHSSARTMPMRLNRPSSSQHDLVTPPRMVGNKVGDIIHESSIRHPHAAIVGRAIVLGHLSLVDGVHVSAATVVTRSITQPGQYTGLFPIDDNATWEKNAASLKQLHKLRERIKLLETQHLQPHFQENKS